MAIVVSNCSCLRERRKKLSLSRLLYEHSASVGVLTETHLRQWEVDRLQLPGYHVVASYCREATDRAGGGVIIVAHNSMNAEPCGQNVRIEVPFKNCENLSRRKPRYLSAPDGGVKKYL